MTKLVHYITIYLVEVAIGKFKEQKAHLYLSMVKHFCVKEIENAHLQATLWHSMLDVVNN